MAPLRIGIYGGTFDPVHIGHLAVAQSVGEQAALDQVLFVPNNRQPLKAQGPFAPAPARVRMLRTAIAGNPRFALSEVEVAHEGPSYSIDTLDELRRRYPDAELRFILGADAAAGLPHWREPRRLIEAYRPLIMARAGYDSLDWEPLERLHPAVRSLTERLEVPRLEIASSELRELVARGRSIRYLVPDGVAAIIAAEGLYVARQAP